MTTRAKTIALQAIPELFTRLPGICVALAVLGAFLYGTLLLMTVAHAASIEDAQAQIHSLSAELARSEAQYLQKSQAITPEVAAGLGFVTSTTIARVYADAATRSLSLKIGN